MEIHSCEVVHVATTRAPTEQWTAQQLRNITSFGDGPEVIIRDRDQKSGTRAVCGGSAKVISIPVLQGLHHDYQLAA